MTGHDTARVPGARDIAATVIARVLGDDAFASAALDAEIRRWPQLDPRDVGLATELVYGVLRTEGFLEAVLERHATRGRITLEGEARGHLLAGAYAILFLDRVPIYASVNEGAAGVGRATDPRVAGFANALLRGIAREVEERGKPTLAHAALEGAPGWLRGALRRSIGRKGAADFLAAGPVPPPLGIALAPGEDRDEWLSRLREAAPGATIEAGNVSPRCINVRGAGDARRLPGEGFAWIAQEEGAQALALLVGAQPGERVLDACAGRGNKAWLLSAAVGDAGAIEAADIHPRKLEELADGPLAGKVARTHAVDWEAGTGDVDAGFDRVLVDAPCSGVGTLRRRPEIGRKRSEDDVARLAELQVKIARRAATRARPGGVVVFAVCSVLDAECEGVAAILAKEGDATGRPLVPVALPGASVIGIDPTATSIRLLPQEHGTDGYFAASFRVGS
jgi:16S rRNA (cytosine967-C5)-methyltransferase